MPSENFYNDGAPAAAPQSPETTETSGENVAALPKSFFPDAASIQKGNFARVRVEEVLEDQVLVSPAPAAEEPDERDEEMESLMT